MTPPPPDGQLVSKNTPHAAAFKRTDFIVLGKEKNSIMGFESSQSEALFCGRNAAALISNDSIFLGVDAELPCNISTQPLLPRLVKSPTAQTCEYFVPLCWQTSVICIPSVLNCHLGFSLSEEWILKIKFASGENNSRLLIAFVHSKNRLVLS